MKCTFDSHEFIAQMKKRIKNKILSIFHQVGASELLFAESRNISPSLVRKARQKVHSPSEWEWPRSNLLLLRVNSVFRWLKCWEWCEGTPQSPDGASWAEASFIALGANICVFGFLQVR